MTLLSPFQTLLKEKEVTEGVHIGGTPEGHLKGAVDLEVTKIASENLMTSGGLDATETAPRESTDDADQAGETEV
jgi:hypothetical protein